ncbi:MAG: hypothetical protein A2Y38_22360 [Spirochaetes bacterium GWB1_59_5]|nr:MAG: hypothetical protein A2Y38_22360 [Spirochaetes bacterium GWB1_59_5]
MPDDVLLRGIGTGAVKVQMLGVTADTTLLTMGENSRVEDMALKLTSSEHHTLKGVVFPGTTSATAKLRTATVLVDNSGAGAGASEVYGVHSTGTGSPGVETSAIRAVTVTVASAGTGNKRGILVDAANKFNVRDTNVKVSGGGASNIGVETNHASAEFHAATGVFSGTTASISQTAGILAISSVDLVESSANGIGFTADSVSFGATWADPGGLPGGGARYMRPGTATVSVTEVFLRVPRKAVIKTLSVRATAAPGAGKNTVFTVRKNGVDTILTATLSGTALTVEDLTHSVAFASGDSISVSEVNDAGSVVSDVVVTVEIY